MKIAKSLHARKPDPQIDYTVPVLLVPGIFDTAARMKKMERYLRRAGINAQVVSPQPSDGTIGLDVMAWKLAGYIESAFPADQPLALVGFSMGGLICRSYIQQMGGRLRTRQLITLSTPHHGTYTGYFFDRPAPIQMRPGSYFLRELNRDLAPLAEVDFTSIWTPCDLTILPAESSRMPVGRMVQIPTLIHHFVVEDRRVWCAVEQALKGSGAGGQ